MVTSSQLLQLIAVMMMCFWRLLVLIRLSRYGDWISETPIALCMAIPTPSQICASLDALIIFSLQARTKLFVIGMLISLNKSCCSRAILQRLTAWQCLKPVVLCFLVGWIAKYEYGSGQRTLFFLKKKRRENWKSYLIKSMEVEVSKELAKMMTTTTLVIATLLPKVMPLFEKVWLVLLLGIESLRQSNWLIRSYLRSMRFVKAAKERMEISAPQTHYCWVWSLLCTCYGYCELLRVPSSSKACWYYLRVILNDWSITLLFFYAVILVPNCVQRPQYF
mmetsp:Transcript_25677/g.39791  ORF Transcript_25677/g.39791 Transcript_25677/m.39791 type:complete len:278 (+) Transcript_25677:242-1075(+)